MFVLVVVGVFLVWGPRNRKGGAKNKGGNEVGEEESEEERAERMAHEAEYEAELERLRDKYKVEPEKDPESLAEAREEYQAVRKMVGTPHAGPFDRFKADWLKAQVAWWTASEGLKTDEEKQKNVQWCLDNGVLDLEEEAPKYERGDLEGKDVKQLRKLCQEEKLDCKEPILFGKKAFLVEQLAAVKKPPSGMREFIKKKLNKPDYVRNEVLTNQMDNIKRFKETLEAARVQAAKSELDEKEKELSAKFKKAQWERRQAKIEAERAAKRAARQQEREERKQAKRNKQIEDEVARREADKLEKARKAEQAARLAELEARKQQAREAEQAQQRQLACQNDQISESFNAIVDTSRGGTWVVTWQGPVRVRELPLDTARPLAFHSHRDYLEAVGVVEGEDGREWLKLASPDKGFVLVGSQQSQACNVERVDYHVGYNGYAQAQWDAKLEQLADFKRRHGHTHVWPFNRDPRLAHSSGTANLPDAERAAEEGALHKWVWAQRRIVRDGRLPQSCADKLLSLKVTTDLEQAEQEGAKARDKAQVKASLEAKDEALISQNDFDASRGGVWEVVWQGPVRVRDEPSAASTPLGFKTFGQRVGTQGVVSNADGEDWIKLGPEERGFMLVDTRHPADSAGGGGGVTRTPNLARVQYHVGVNGYDMRQWDGYFLS